MAAAAAQQRQRSRGSACAGQHMHTPISAGSPTSAWKAGERLTSSGLIPPPPLRSAASPSAESAETTLSSPNRSPSASTVARTAGVSPARPAAASRSSSSFACCFSGCRSHGARMSAADSVELPSAAEADAQLQLWTGRGGGGFASSAALTTLACSSAGYDPCVLAALSRATAALRIGPQRRSVWSRPDCGAWGGSLRRSQITGQKQRQNALGGEEATIGGLGQCPRGTQHQRAVGRP